MSASRPTIAVGAHSSGVAITPDGAELYVVNNGSDTVSVRDLPLPAVVTSGSPPPATTGTAYSFTLIARGRPAPTFAVSAGLLPLGLQLDSTTGVISGTPTETTTSVFTVSANNGVGPAVTADYVVGVASVPPLNPASPAVTAGALADSGLDAIPATLLATLLISAGAGLVLTRRSGRRAT